MIQLPTHKKKHILGFIPRRVHPSAIIMRKAIDECVRYYTSSRYPIEKDEMWNAWWYVSAILDTYKDKFECRECDCCGELLADCQCMCECGDDYIDCRAGCRNQGSADREYLRYCGCCSKLWVECQRKCTNHGKIIENVSWHVSIPIIMSMSI